ncbi:hypothetical protein Zmor_027013 [Zophobas morio]|uniref:Uncharacterized protein n=1 Tax=Zophobas morio TaxID=2755281 RepID=A0AA38M615_9CUCU|nr:hypothetical protein Zmor_027013 [Zophobas morio]
MRQQVAIQTNEPNKINLEENPAAQRIADNQLRDLEIGAAMQPREQNSSDNWTKASVSYFIKEKKKVNCAFRPSGNRNLQRKWNFDANTSRYNMGIFAVLVNPEKGL